jgi:cobalamin biosynthesis Mg chelatase CobN
VSAFANAGETVYETEIPSVTSEPKSGGTEKMPTHHSSPNTGKSGSDQAHGSNAGTGGGSEGSDEGSGSKGHKKEGSSSKEEEGNPSTGAGGGGNTPNGGAGNGGQSESGLSGNEPVEKTATGTPVSKSSGGSSPVVPILIAVVVLAAISIGVVLYRQRKSGQGGSDGRVSSSNAS